MPPLKFGDKKLMGFIRIKLSHKPVYIAIIYLAPLSVLSSSSPGTALFYIFQVILYHIAECSQWQRAQCSLSFYPYLFMNISIYEYITPCTYTHSRRLCPTLSSLIQDSSPPCDLDISHHLGLLMVLIHM